MARQFFSGNSIEQAVLSAASHFGLDPKDVAYKVRDKKHGFIKIRRRVVIEVDPEAPRKDAVEEKPSEAVGGESIAVLEKIERKRPAPGDRSTKSPPEDHPDDSDEDRFDEDDVAEDADDDLDDDDLDDDDLDDEEVDDEDDWDDEDEDDDDEWEDEDDEDDDEDREIAAFEKATDRLIDFLDIDIEYDIERRDDLFEIELSGADTDVVVADEGKVLEAIEHLLPRLVRGYVGHGLPCRVDCDGFRAARQQDLLELADDAASAVKEAGRGLMLEPMNPADRRVIHLALADDPDVVTESEGDGYMKRVRVLPSDGGSDEVDEFVDEIDDDDDFEDDVEDGVEDDDEEDSKDDDYDDEDDSEDDESDDDDYDDEDDSDDDDYDDEDDSDDDADDIDEDIDEDDDTVDTSDEGADGDDSDSGEEVAGDEPASEDEGSDDGGDEEEKGDEGLPKLGGSGLE